MIFKRQVDDFAVATLSQQVANKLSKMIDNKLTFPLKRMGLVKLFNGMDVIQTRNYIKISVETYINKIMPKYLIDPVNLRIEKFKAIKPTPLPTQKAFETAFCKSVGDPDPQVQAKLAKQMGFNYRSAVGELIYALVTCCPDLSYGIVRCSQVNARSSETYYNAVKHMLKYLFNRKDDGIYFWRQQPNHQLPKGELPRINSNEHDLLRDGRPIDHPEEMSAYVDADWATCPKTQRSFTGVCLRLAGGTIAYKFCLQPTVAQSSTEAEFMAAHDAGKLILFVQSILWDLGNPQAAAILIYEDNDACTAMTNAEKTHKSHKTYGHKMVCTG